MNNIRNKKDTPCVSRWEENQKAKSHFYFDNRKVESHFNFRIQINFAFVIKNSTGPFTIERKIVQQAFYWQV